MWRPSPLPPGSEERDCGRRTMGVELTIKGVSDLDVSREKNVALGPLPPPTPRGTGLRLEDDGGGLKHLGTSSRSSTPAPARKRDSGKKTMGVDFVSARKNRAGSVPENFAKAFPRPIDDGCGPQLRILRRRRF